MRKTYCNAPWLPTYRDRDYLSRTYVDYFSLKQGRVWIQRRGGGLGSSTIFKKFNEPYAPS